MKTGEKKNNIMKEENKVILIKEPEKIEPVFDSKYLTTSPINPSFGGSMLDYGFPNIKYKFRTKSPQYQNAKKLAFDKRVKKRRKKK